MRCRGDCILLSRIFTDFNPLTFYEKACLKKKTFCLKNLHLPACRLFEALYITHLFQGPESKNALDNGKPINYYFK
jgi:hypothetical protein